MKIIIIGAGYVGLVSGACFSDFGHTVICIDKDEDKIDSLMQGKIPIYEPGLDSLILKNIEERRLYFSSDLSAAITGADAVFIAVGTPSRRRGDGFANLEYMYSAARELAPLIKDYMVVVTKSTVPVGTGRQLHRIIKETNPHANFDVASNPEFMREGAAIKDFMLPDRVVIGADSTRATQILKDIYNPLYLISTPFVVTSIETAELIKYASNAFLAVKISFINEIANLCEAIDANVIDVAKAMGLDGRIGNKFLHPGPGFGGSCFPKDTLALMRIAQEHGSSVRIVESAVEVNAAQKCRMIKKIKDAFDGKLENKIIAVLGLTFKPETDDMRDAPSLTILPALTEKGAILKVHDPKGMQEASNYLKEISFTHSPYEACNEADAVVLLTEWHQYRALDLERIRNSMDNAKFIDLRNVYEPQKMREYGFEYIGVGRN